MVNYKKAMNLSLMNNTANPFLDEIENGTEEI